MTPPSVSTVTSNGSGSCLQVGDLAVQWGTITTGADTTGYPATVTVSFPCPFLDSTYVLTTTPVQPTNDDQVFFSFLESQTTTSAVIGAGNLALTGTGSGPPGVAGYGFAITASWTAVGRWK